MQPVRWGILSTAKIGVQKVIPAMQANPACEIVAIASRDGARAQAAAQQLSIPRAHPTYEALLADPDVEAIYNPLPNHLHVPLSIDALRAGKHVLCEKPLALTADEARQLIAARDETGLQVSEAFMVRGHPQWLRTREIIRSGKIGPLRAVMGFFSYFNDDPANIRNIPEWGGGGIFDIGCYPLVGARFAFESEPFRVSALIDRDPNFGTDRLSSAILDFPAGHAIFTCSTQLVPYQRIQFFGTKGRIEIEIPFNAPPDKPTRLYVDDGSALGDASRVEVTFPVCDQYAIQGELFSKAIRGEEPLAFPLEDAIQNMTILEAILKSGETNHWEAI